MSLFWIAAVLCFIGYGISGWLDEDWKHYSQGCDHYQEWKKYKRGERDTPPPMNYW